jgi:hypothetical protein
MQQLAAEANTTAKWEGVIADLAAKRQRASEHTERLCVEKQQLALEVAMGGGDAKKKLDKINSELARLAAESDLWGTAMGQAEAEKRKAEHAEAEAADRARQQELSTLATAAVRHAAEYTAALRQAAKAGASVKLVIQNMLSRATPQESRGLNQLLGCGAFMRAAEHAGMRAHLEFESYRGLKEHVVALEADLAGRLERWLKEGDGTND